MEGSGIPDDIAESFPLETQAEGAEYHREGRVRDMLRADRAITAWVRGAERHDVRIFVDELGALDYTCDCQTFAHEGVCPHVWATLISARRRGWLFGNRAFLHGHAKRREPTPRWKKALDETQAQMSVATLTPQNNGNGARVDWPETRRVVYVIDAAATAAVPHGAPGAPAGLVIELATQTLGRSGEWTAVKRLSGGPAQLLGVADPRDQEIAQMLVGVGSPQMPVPYATHRQFLLRGPSYDTALRRIVDTGRCVVRDAEGKIFPVTWDAEKLWAVRLRIVSDESGTYQLHAEFGRDRETLDLSEPRIVLADGMMVTRTAVSRYAPADAFPLMQTLREFGTFTVTDDEVPLLLQSLYALPTLPELDIPESLHVTHVWNRPLPKVSIIPLSARQWGPPMAGVRLSFMYGDVVVSFDHPSSGEFQRDGRRVVHRDAVAERSALDVLLTIGCRQEYSPHPGVPSLLVPQSRVDVLVAHSVALGWDVEHEGRRIRQAGAQRADVASGIDWFDLSMTVDFGGISAGLPELLAAWRRGDRTLTLSDGSIGVLPLDWLSQYGALAALGDVSGDIVRFTRAQTGLLDVLLAAMPMVSVDAQFERARDALRDFAGVAPADAPDSFTGVLRPYQREGVGWLHFLRTFGFGGCLADDMGLGKTVQVLAVLDERRRGGHGPSLVVVPKSLVFNWQQEAARFTPEMRVLAHGGIQRAREIDALDGYDLVITTYATLRRDAMMFKDVEFDYVVLDEAQAIKNARTESAKAARLLRGRHRLAISGTPVENRLEDLWSIFEFLNPGVLGSASVFRALGNDSARAAETRPLVARALRPFILRRTKAQVASELPERVEQTLYVDLEPEQRRLYDELRDHYRASLLSRVARDGINKAKIQILEALLRLRQAACHPGLIDAERATESSSKLDVLVSHVAEVVAEGHKVLVFSQFTSLLAIVRTRMEAEGIAYEYLDGKTRDRQERVERFQTDPNCQLFLISLKAGGVGLNLTAAEYVFLLDPWWNPAVEAQAIDRAHRIGQEERVFATRLIARDTVEEKVLQLQDSKRDLADAIINADNSVISRLGRDELELLLS